MNWEYHADFMIVHSGRREESFSLHMMEEFGARLQEKGNNGWELVQALPVSSGYVCFFKRQAE